MKDLPMETNHLWLHLVDGRRVFIAAREVSDSYLCNKGRELMGTEWDGSKVECAQTFITEGRRGYVV